MGIQRPLTLETPPVLLHLQHLLGEFGVKLVDIKFSQSQEAGSSWTHLKRWRWEVRYGLRGGMALEDSLVLLALAVKGTGDLSATI